MKQAMLVELVREFWEPRQDCAVPVGSHDSVPREVVSLGAPDDPAESESLKRDRVTELAMTCPEAAGQHSEGHVTEHCREGIMCGGPPDPPPPPHPGRYKPNTHRLPLWRRVWLTDKHSKQRYPPDTPDITPPTPDSD